MAKPSTSRHSAGPSTSRASAGPSTSRAPAGPSTSRAPTGSSTSRAPAGPSTSRAPASPSTPTAPASPAASSDEAQAGPSTPKRKKNKKKKGNLTKDQAAQALSFRHDAEKCRPVPDLPCIMTCNELDQWGLGIVSDWNLLACTRCDKSNRIVDFTKVRDHVKLHFKDLPSRVTTRRFQSVCRKYGVVEDENVADAAKPRNMKTPRHGIAPQEFLEYYELWKCTACEDRSIDAYMASDRSRRRHHAEVHKNLGSENTFCDRIIWAQTFFAEKSLAKIWFEVDPRLLHLRKYDIDHVADMKLSREATAEEMVKAYYSLWKPAKHSPIQVDELRDVMPMLHITGFAQHAGNLTKELRPLVHLLPQNNPHAYIYYAALDIWKEDQKEVHKIFDPIRVALLNDESGKKDSLFMPLAKDTSMSYGQLWGRWCVFICRLRVEMQKQNPSYAVEMTVEQAKWADEALLYCARSEQRKYNAKQLLYELSAAFWRATDPGHCDRLVQDKFSDPTVRFGCLINIREGGDFNTPSNTCHELVRMKYIMRQVL
ncbi:hypothetical protein FRC09_001318 [Ceratobasidium sp. 395]|nr:hypothetical protein FRC09_001318 [Ceratobasidium sp. 395]